MMRVYLCICDDYDNVCRYEDDMCVQSEITNLVADIDGADVLPCDAKGNGSGGAGSYSAGLDSDGEIRKVRGDKTRNDDDGYVCMYVCMYGDD